MYYRYIYPKQTLVVAQMPFLDFLISSQKYWRHKVSALAFLKSIFSTIYKLLNQKKLTLNTFVFKPSFVIQIPFCIYNIRHNQLPDVWKISTAAIFHPFSARLHSSNYLFSVITVLFSLKFLLKYSWCSTVKAAMFSITKFTNEILKKKVNVLNTPRNISMKYLVLYIEHPEDIKICYA